MGVSINVLNQSLKRIAVVDDYTSLIWAKRYNDIGAVDLQIEATTENLQLFKKYNYISRDDDDAVYRIEAVELDTSVEEANYLIVGAYDCKKILNQRIVWNQLNFKGTVENFIRKIITDNIIDPVNSQRRINNFLLKPARGFADEIEAQTTYDNVGEKVIELCAANNYGWRITLEGGAWYFDLYKGVDRSEWQGQYPHVVFSPDYDNLSSTKYTMDASEYKNVALVAGEGEGVQRKSRTLGNAAGIDRFEVFVESNVSSTTEEGDLVDYYEALIADGKEQLAERATTTSFEGEIDPTMYRYKVDYNLGDIVTVRNEYGISANARIIEVAETWDSEGYSIDPVFEFMPIDEAFEKAILTQDYEVLLTEDSEVLSQE